ncbi:MAG: tetratricopeptide repeat protein [Rudaea sp.]|nr:tetratricopeptide repeat protein [Rudaea sp.]
MTLEEALERHKSGRLDAAEAAYRECLQATPDDADALHLLGVLCQQRGDHAQAGDLIRRALQIEPESVQFHLSLGGVLMHAGDEAAARASFEAALALDPNSIEAHALTGHAQLRQGDMGGAEDRFRIARRAEEEDPLVLLGLGSVYLARRDAVNAAKFLSRAAERKPDDVAIQTSLGQALFEQGAFAFAEQAFANAVRLQPGLGLARLYLARARLRQDKNDAARELFTELAAENVQAFGANAGLGDVARKGGHVVKALKFYRRALSIDPGHAGAANACAWCMEQLGDLEGAVRYLAMGLQHAPDAEELRVPLAALLERMGRVDEAARVRQDAANKGDCRE